MNVRFFSFIVGVTLAVAATASHAYDSRLWIDSTGTFTADGFFDAERTFAGTGDVVYFTTSNGKTRSCELAKLSQADQDYVSAAKAIHDSGDEAKAEEFEWISDPQRNPAARRVLKVDDVEYAFRWVPPGVYREPIAEYDPNVLRSVSANKTESKKKKEAPKKTVRPGFWMLETEVTLEMFNQFVTETQYQVGQKGNEASRARAATKKATDSNPYGDVEDDVAKTVVNEGDKSKRLGYSGSPQKTAGLKRGDEFTWKNPGFPQTKKHPVTLVAIRDAKAFCFWLSKKLGKDVMLPTRAQWFLASQPEKGYLSYASLFDRWAFGGSEDWERGNLPDRNYAVICPIHAYVMSRVNFVSRDSYRFTVPVGSFKPNGNGLYDMVGNVGEFVVDEPDAVESLGGSWFHLPGFNPICWVNTNELGLNQLDRAIHDYETSRTAPLFAESFPQIPYDDYAGGTPLSDPMAVGGDPMTNGGTNVLGGSLQGGNPFAEKEGVKPFVHTVVPYVEATCYTGFRVIIQ